ncbi:MAG TPA: hypothetical protein VGX21_05705 [Methylomirabilota bacterium]|jgi:hypothetical protein|nr:hypothetical protein [Gemmatimonadales bacterium]HEV8673523.1 hypothetical protein [Methylomirabilota bacterium]
MSRTGLALILAIGLVATVVVGDVEAGPIQFRGSGSFLTQGTSIDTNGDGVTADLFIVSGSSSQLGALTNQTVAEWAFGPPSTCPPGTVLEGTLVPAGSALVTRAVNGDLLFGAPTSGTNCISATGVASISAAGVYTGGTGRFANATGDFTIAATATTLAADPAGHAFGGVVATSEGTLDK